MQDIETTQAKLAATPVPAWYFPVIAVLIVPIPVINLLPSNMTGGLVAFGAMVMWVGLLGIVVGLGVRKIGMVPRIDTHVLRKVWIPIAAVPVFGMVAAVLNLSFGLWWGGLRLLGRCGDRCPILRGVAAAGGPEDGHDHK